MAPLELWGARLFRPAAPFARFDRREPGDTPGATRGRWRAHEPCAIPVKPGSISGLEGGYNTVKRSLYFTWRVIRPRRRTLTEVRRSSSRDEVGQTRSQTQARISLKHRSTRHVIGLWRDGCLVS
jgi:hypothetical protein